MLTLSLLLTLMIIQVKDVSAACDSATLTSESATQAVEIKFYRVQTDEWTSGGNSEKVAVQVSDMANRYCAANPGTCGVTNCCTDAFKDSNVGTTTGYPENSKKDLALKIFLSFPPSLNASGTLQCVVGEEALRTIIGDAREKIHDDTGFWITYAGDDFYGIPPAKTLNAIIIPIACVVLLGIIIMTLVLHFWNKRREAAARRQKIVDDRKKSSKNKIQPTYHVDTKEPKVPEGITGKNTDRQKPKRKDDLYKQRLGQAKTTGSFHSDDSAIKVDSEPRQRQAYDYERRLDGDSALGATGDSTAYGRLKPLHREPESDDVPNESPEKEKKKKKKKKKRSKSKENTLHGEENGTYNTTDVHESGMTDASYGMTDASY